MCGQTGKPGNPSVPVSSSVNMDCPHQAYEQAELGLLKQSLASADLCGKVRTPPNIAEDMGANKCYLCTITSCYVGLTTVFPSHKVGYKKEAP